MTTNTKDRRVRRTRRALQNALISLILEKGYDAVTIENITERADLGRTTFYLHYKDKEELFMQAIDSICEEFLEKHEDFLELAVNPKTAIKRLHLNLNQRILYYIFANARDNADLYKVMLRGEGSAKASRRFTTIIAEKSISHLSKMQGLKVKVPVDIFSVFFSGTLVELVTWWLEEDQPYSIEEMVTYYQQIFIYGALNTMSLVDVPEN